MTLFWPGFLLVVGQALRVYVQESAEYEAGYFAAHLARFFWAVKIESAYMRRPEPVMPPAGALQQSLEPYFVSWAVNHARQNTTDDHLLILHGNIGFAYTKLWPTPLTHLISQANTILPSWDYIMLHWYTDQWEDVYQKWWASVDKRLSKFSRPARLRLHRQWPKLPPTAIPHLRLPGHPNATISSMALLLSPGGVQRLHRRDYKRRSSMLKYLGMRGFLAAPVYLGPREVGAGGDQTIVQWLLEAREVMFSGLQASLPAELRFVRRLNAVRFDLPESEQGVWHEYDSRRYRRSQDSQASQFQAEPPFLHPQYRQPVQDWVSASGAPSIFDAN